MAETVLLIGPNEQKQVKVDPQNPDKLSIEKVLRTQELHERTPFLRWELAVADDNPGQYINRAVFGEVDPKLKLRYVLEAFDFPDEDASDDLAQELLLGRAGLEYAQARLDGKKRRLLIARELPKIKFVQTIVKIANKEHERFEGRNENNPTAQKMIDEYWAGGLEQKNKGDAWSAAFVSYVMRTAGLTRSQFAFGSAHRIYITAAFSALKAEDPNHATYAYVPKRLEEHEPQPGDLICSYYDGEVTYEKAAAATAADGYYSHCDIVVENTGTEIVVVGGNVSDTVTKRRFPLADKRLTKQGFATAFAVLANRFATLQLPQGNLPVPGSGFNTNTNLKTTKSPLTEEKIRAFFDARQKPALRDIGGPVLKAAEKYGINATYMVAHAILESGWGTSRFARERHNLFGWGARFENPDEAWYFDSFAHCIDIVMGRINELYLKPGGTYYDTGPVLGDLNHGMNANYDRSNARWGADIAKLARQIEK